MTEDCHIRLFAPGDLLRLQDIRKAAFAPVFASFRTIVGEDIAAVVFATAEQEQADHLNGLCATDSAKEVYVAERKGETAGFCAVSLDRASGVGEIGLNAVHPDHQGEGLGALLYAFALRRMKEAGMKVAAGRDGRGP